MPEDQTMNDDMLLPIDIRLFAMSLQMQQDAAQAFYNANTFHIEFV